MILSSSPWLDNLYGPSIINLFETFSRLGYQTKIILPSTSDKLVRNGSFSIISFKLQKSQPLFRLASIYKCFLKFIFQEKQATLVFDYMMLPLFLVSKLLYKSKGILLVLSRPILIGGFRSRLNFFCFRLSLIIGKLFVDKFTAISPFEAVEYSRMGKIRKQKMMVLPSPLGEHFKKNSSISEDQLRLKLGLDILFRKKVLLYQGALSELRGILEVLEAFSRDFKEDSEIALLIVGDGPAKDSVKRFILNNDIQNIILHGPVPYSSMPEIIAASDIGLVLLPDRLIWRYQCPTKLIELLAMGKPVIASDLPGIRWIADNSPSVIYSKNLTILNFKEAVKKALINREIEIHQEIIERFSSYSIALRLSQVVSTFYD